MNFIFTKMRKDLPSKEESEQGGERGLFPRREKTSPPWHALNFFW